MIVWHWPLRTRSGNPARMLAPIFYRGAWKYAVAILVAPDSESLAIYDKSGQQGDLPGPGDIINDMTFASDRPREMVEGDL